MTRFSPEARCSWFSIVRSANPVIVFRRPREQSPSGTWTSSEDAMDRRKFLLGLLGGLAAAPAIVAAASHADAAPVPEAPTPHSSDPTTAAILQSDPDAVPADWAQVSPPARRRLRRGARRVGRLERRAVRRGRRTARRTRRVIRRRGY